jgi:hypothetical protein
MSIAPASDPLAAVREPDGTVDWLAVGEAEQARRQGHALPGQIAVLAYLRSHGGTAYVNVAAIEFMEWHREEIRKHGGTTTTSGTRDGVYFRETVVHRGACGRRRAPRGLARRPRTRAFRPRARRTSASSTTSSCDPGDDGPHHPRRALGTHRVGVVA